MDIEQRLLELQQVVEEARSLPLSGGSVVVNRQEVLDLVQEALDALPQEVREARWLLEDRDEVLARARREAEELLERAYQERDRLVAETEVVQAATREAEDILAEARHDARVLRQEAQEYVQGKLEEFEGLLRRMLHTVERGRERLALDAGERPEEVARQPPPA